MPPHISCNISSEITAKAKAGAGLWVLVDLTVSTPYEWMMPLGVMVVIWMVLEQLVDKEMPNVD